MRFLLRCALAFVLSTLIGSVVWSGELLTFEEGRLADQFDALPSSTLVRWFPNSSIESSQPRPTGRAVRLSAPAGGGFVTKAAMTDSIDWLDMQSLGIWLHRTEDEAREHPTIELEIRLIESDRKAFFWRRLEVSHTGWQKIVLPLDWFAWSQDSVPRWPHVRYLGFRLRDAGSITIDTVWTEQADQPRQLFLTPSEIARVAFSIPKSAEALPSNEVTIAPPRSLETREVQLLTNAPELDLERLASHLKVAVKTVRSELPFLAEPERGPVLVVFRTADQYRQFVPQLARRLSLRIDSPDSDGFTLQGICVSSWNEKFGSLRPVYVHEFLHGYLAHATRLPLRGDWLHEGLAVHFQLKLHPQDDLPQVIATGLSSADQRRPLKELCDGRRLSTSRYWQAAMLCRLLLTDARYHRQLPEFFKRLAVSNSVDLDPYLKPVWNTNWEQLEADWLRHCEAIVSQQSKS